MTTLTRRKGFIRKFVASGTIMRRDPIIIVERVETGNPILVERFETGTRIHDRDRLMRVV